MPSCGFRPAHEPPVSAGAQLLLVEDERNVAETLAERLRRCRFRGDARRIRRQVHAAPWRGEQLQLAILDVGLPDGSGFDLARQLRTRAPPPRSCS